MIQLIKSDLQSEVQTPDIWLKTLHYFARKIPFEDFFRETAVITKFRILISFFRFLFSNSEKIDLKIFSVELLYSNYKKFDLHILFFPSNCFGEIENVQNELIVFSRKLTNDE